MDSTVEKIGDVTIFSVVEDRLDAGNVPAFNEEIAQIIESSYKVVLDMTNVEFVDSSGLGAILTFQRRLGEKGGSLKLCGMKQQVSIVFELVHMHRKIEIFQTKEEAVRAF